MKRLLVALAIMAVGCTEGVEEPTFLAPTAEEARAIAVAEQYVFANGYTSAIPPEPKQIRPEFMEGGLPPSLLWELHHNRLLPQAYGVSPQQGANQPGWTVFFEFTEDADALAGVEMTLDFEKVWVCHYDLRLDAPDRVLRPRTGLRVASEP